MKLRKFIASLLSAAVMAAAAPTAFALDSDKVEPWERSAETHRENLGSSIAYLEAFDTSEYTDESVTALKEAIKTAKEQYEDSSQPAKYYYSAHIYNSVENRHKGIYELADNYKDLGCPLILGEWTTYTGQDGSTATGYNDVEKAFQPELVYKYAKVNNICAVAWDIGVFTKDGRVEGGNASYWSREDLKPGFQSQLRGVMRGAYLPLTEENKKGNLENLYEQYGLSAANGVDQHPKTVTETIITAISYENSAEMTVGEIITINPEVTPAGTNDLLVWTTDNDKVAVVSNGRITAKIAGTATITAYALNTVEYGYYGNYNVNPYENAVKKEIKITVKIPTVLLQ